MPPHGTAGPIFGRDGTTSMDAGTRLHPRSRPPLATAALPSRGAARAGSNAQAGPDAAAGAPI